LEGGGFEESSNVSTQGGKKVYPSGRGQTKRRLWVWEGIMMRKKSTLVV